MHSKRLEIAKAEKKPRQLRSPSRSVSKPALPQGRPTSVQTKAVEPSIKKSAAPPPVYRPQSVPKVLQTKAKGVVHPSGPAAMKKGVQSKSVQLKARAGQAVKLFPNLHPGAVESVDPNSIFQLSNFADQYRLQRKNTHGVNVPNQQYNFVRTRDGEMLLHNRYRHPSIAEGKQVLYAGEIFFNNGKLEWWSNGSGHYQPGADDAEQANLPMNYFFSYQQIIKGEHKRRKG